MSFGKLGQSLTAKEILDLVQDDLRKVEREISLESMASGTVVTTISQHLNGNGGKRLRPILLLLSAKLVGETNPSCIHLGAVVEMIHTATLVHDDIIDVAETRRGKPSTNILWGNHTSVLAGDWLYMQAFQIALRERNFHVLDILIALTQSMVEGELVQLERIGRINVTEADYMELIDRKTAGLFSACARLGVVAGGGSESQEQKLGDFAWNLGMAFQLIDDVLDFTAREKVLGKPVGGDLREGKVTLPVIYALQSCDNSERAAIETVINERSYSNASFDSVLHALDRSGGIDRARERASAFSEKARTAIHEFPESPYQRALATVTDLVTNRDF
ncbi:MAG TPA: polyprenyl synthetase family protein [Bryobacteraceae bacterium]|nr:polyprenyl synthetase family protein [Bryobacteraceae bacterium]